MVREGGALRKVGTHARLYDRAGAVEGLQALSPAGPREAAQLKATGTDGPSAKDEPEGGAAAGHALPNRRPRCRPRGAGGCRHGPTSGSTGIGGPDSMGSDWLSKRGLQRRRWRRRGA